jgi:hypothetical protein
VDEKLFIQAVSSGDLKPSTSLTGWQAADGPGVLLGQNLSEQDNELAVIDPVSLEVLRTWKVDGNGTWLPGVLEY